MASIRSGRLGRHGVLALSDVVIVWLFVESGKAVVLTALNLPTLDSTPSIVATEGEEDDDNNNDDDDDDDEEALDSCCAWPFESRPVYITPD